MYSNDATIIPISIDPFVTRYPPITIIIAIDNPVKVSTGGIIPDPYLAALSCFSKLSAIFSSNIS